MSRLFTGLLLALLALAWPTTFGGRVGYVYVEGISMLPTYRTGDLVVTWAERSYHRGDIVVYRLPRGEVGAGAIVVHRIVAVEADGTLRTRGDHNSSDDPWVIGSRDVTGKAALSVPRAGTLVMGALRPLTLGFICAVVTVALLWPRNRSSAGKREHGRRRARARRRAGRTA